MATKWPWLGVLALFLYIAYGMADFDAVSGSSLPAYSSRRHDPFGSSALRELLAVRGRTVASLERPVPDGDGPASLVLLAPMRDLNMDARRAERLLDWVGGGNQLVLFSRGEAKGLDALYRRLDVTRPHDGMELEDLERSGQYREALELYERHTDHAIVEEGPGAFLLLAESAVFSPLRDGGVTALARVGDGAAALSFPWGKGSVVLIGSPSPALNAGIVQDDNADLVLSFIRHDAVYFDEYSLGLGRERSFMEWLRRAGLVPLLAQGMLALFLLARSGDSDFGRDDEEEAAADAPVEEQIRILADLYQRTLSDDELAENLGERHGHQHLRGHTG